MLVTLVELKVTVVTVMEVVVVEVVVVVVRSTRSMTIPFWHMGPAIVSLLMFPVKGRLDSRQAGSQLPSARKSVV